MQTLVVPSWIWLNLVILVVAAIFVRVKLAAQEKAKRQQPQSKSGQDLKAALK
jgi:hypothetical protein